MAKTRPWTTQEEDQLRLLAKKESHSTIAAKLGRSEASIAHRARKLGLAIQPPIVAGRPSLFERIQHFFSGPFTIIKGIGWAISSLLAV